MALVGLFLVSFFVSYFASAYNDVRRMQSRSTFLNIVSQTQINIVNTVNNAASWQATISDTVHNQGMACLANQSCPQAMNNINFVLWPAGTTDYSDLSMAVYDGTNPSNGFSMVDGTPCSTFSTTGSSSCPIHINLSWSTCGASPCTPAVTVTAEFLFRPGVNSPIFAVNEQNYLLQFAQVLTGSTQYCSGLPSASVVAQCKNPPYPNDKIYCLPSGWACGQIYYQSSGQ
jgi:hypothetical protein